MEDIPVPKEEGVSSLSGPKIYARPGAPRREDIFLNDSVGARLAFDDY